MMLRYFDAHCHIQFDQYEKDEDELIAQMKDRGVGGLVVGVDYASSQKAVALAEKHAHLFAAIGLHPHYEKEEWYDFEKYRALAKTTKVVAVGECGLDYFRPEGVNNEVKKRQRALLNDQIRLAGEHSLPLVIHARPSKGTQDAYRDLIEILTEAKKTYPTLTGDVHFFVGGEAEMRDLVALGFTVSFTAVVTFARDYDAVIRAAPRESILSETDAPYVAPKSRRGERNDPLAVEEVVAKLAEVRGEEKEAVRTAVLENAKRLFRRIS